MQVLYIYIIMYVNFILLCLCRVSGFADSDFAPVLHTLVEAYKEKEESVYNKCCDDSIFRTMDNEASIAWILKSPTDLITLLRRAIITYIAQLAHCSRLYYCRVVSLQ